MKRAKRSSLTGARWLLAARETGAGRAVLGRSILERVGATGAGGGSEALLRILPLGEGAAVLTGRGVRGGGLRGGGLRGVRLRGGRVDAAVGSGLGLGGLGPRPPHIRQTALGFLLGFLSGSNLKLASF